MSTNFCFREKFPFNLLFLSSGVKFFEVYDPIVVAFRCLKARLLAVTWPYDVTFILL